MEGHGECRGFQVFLHNLEWSRILNHHHYMRRQWRQCFGATFRNAARSTLHMTRCSVAVVGHGKCHSSPCLLHNQMFSQLIPVPPLHDGILTWIVDHTAKTGNSVLHIARTCIVPVGYGMKLKDNMENDVGTWLGFGLQCKNGHPESCNYSHHRVPKSWVMQLAPHHVYSLATPFLHHRRHLQCVQTLHIITLHQSF